MPVDLRTEALLEANRQAAAARRRRRWALAGVLGILGAAFASVVVTECREGVAKAASVALGFAVAELPAGLAAVWATGWRRPAKVAITAVVVLLSPVLLVGWLFSAICP